MKPITKLAVASLSLVLGSQAIAGPECTQESKEKWQSMDSFKDKLAKDGYRVKRYKITSGNCYEIYGWNKDNQKAEIYFNPVSGAIVKQEIDD